MSILTNWGYALVDDDSLFDMMDYAEYCTYSGRSDSAERVEAEISAACASIRNYVGWHLYPSASCRFEALASDRRVIYHGSDMLIQLPARYVSAVSAVTVDSVEYTHYYIDTNGLLTIFNVRPIRRYAVIAVEYEAGLTDEMMAPIKELIAHRVTHAMAVPAGVTSEASGGVSVTYNATWINNSRATALAGDNKELLIPYKVQGVF
jgi:hypothetical protein